jgi:hypothetical protein
VQSFTSLCTIYPHTSYCAIQTIDFLTKKIILQSSLKLMYKSAWELGNCDIYAELKFHLLMKQSRMKLGWDQKVEVKKISNLTIKFHFLQKLG